MHPSRKVLVSLGLSSAFVSFHAYAQPESNAASVSDTPAQSDASMQVTANNGAAEYDAQTSNNPPAAELPPAPDAQEDAPWIDRYHPLRNQFEVGIFGGILRLNDEHELFSPDSTLPNEGFAKLNKVLPEVGLRLGYYPLAALGLEVEGAALPTGLRDADGNALVWRGGGHLILQLPRYSVIPFLAAGGGALGVASDRDVLGNDVDPEVHFGGGVKVNVTRHLQFRVDVRDLVSTSLGRPNRLDSHNLEVLVGLSGVFGGKKPASEPRSLPDSDGDGIIDAQDQCPHDPETVNGFQDEDGCPESDRDGDGVWDNPQIDKCPDVFAQTPDGCPPDTDGDGIIDPEDKCPQQPETVNGFEDDDGCPDAVPAPVQAFTGSIDGIQFEFDSAKLRNSSYPTLDAAVDVLQEHPSVRIEIAGHTDSRGTEKYNKTLGLDRANTVRDYLVQKGVAADRIETRPAGFEEPLATNETDEGRAQNRRIEFIILTR